MLLCSEFRSLDAPEEARFAVSLYFTLQPKVTDFQVGTLKRVVCYFEEGGVLL